MQLLKPCVQSADNQNRNETQSALWDVWYDLLCALAVCFVFLQLASVCASFLSRVEGHGDVISSLLGYKCVFKTRTESNFGALQTELDTDHICHALVSMFWTWSWAQVLLITPFDGQQPYTDHGNVLHYQLGLDQANWDGTISVLMPLYVSNEKDVYAPSDSSINNIYNRNASCHFWCNLPFIPIIFAITSFKLYSPRVPNFFKCNTEKSAF